MSDFLANLTTRSFSTRATVRPRLASLFESSRNEQAEVSALAQEEVRALPVATEIVHEIGEQPRLAARGFRNEVQEGKRPSTVRVLTASPVPAKSSPIDVRHLPLIADQRGPGPKFIAPPAIDNPQTTVALKNNKEKSEPSLTFPPGPDQLRPATREISTNPTLAPETAEDRNSSPLISHKIPADLVAQISKAAQALKIESKPDRRRTPKQKPEASDVELEPTINVTIGKIEVRAVPESRSGGSARTASPVMSLDEYLQRRTQRGAQ